MKITVIDNQTPRGVGTAPFTRSFQAEDMINKNVCTCTPELRARALFTEIRKLLLYSRFYSPMAPWDDRILSKLELHAGPIEIEARFPHRWSAPQPLTHQVAIDKIEKATARNRQELKFYVNWFPFSTTHNALVAIALAEESFKQVTAPLRDNIAFQKKRTLESWRKVSQKLFWEQAVPTGTVG